MILLLIIMLAYFVIACFVTVCAEKIFELQEFYDEDNIAQYLLGMFWIISIPFMICVFGGHYLGKVLCKKFRKLLNVNYPC